MSLNKKRPKAVLKKKREIEGAKKFAKDVVMNNQKKAKALLDRFMRQKEQLALHKQNTISGQVDNIYSTLEEE